MSSDDSTKKPNTTGDASTSVEVMETKKGPESPTREPNDLPDKADLLNWLDESDKLDGTRKSRHAGRRRTTIVDSAIKRELADIIGKGGWREAPTPEQLGKLQTLTPVASKYFVDLVSSPSNASSSSSSSTASSSPSKESSTRVVSPDLALRRLAATRNLFLDSAIAELEENQLKFALIMVAVLVIVIHMFISLVNSN